MKITRELLDKIAHLARLEINEAEAEKLMQDMSEIITWVEKLNEVDTTGVEPLTTMSHELNSMREDVPQPHLPHEDALRNAPQRNDAFFKVPKVVE
ncbi:MAG: Asp-tRNA(Asn)/Glu-tRNA(Gln) amidotransferase subunit GatC [Cyclobacteriaceae bacterium]|jgi:aspartyl-tRNA(Asn)/glutamyl-tRNA(Gln) amidotransferase subunit C|nr:Asp-tRNA(Asn)/Glu-tRNA(Gln) amidotransferase subunit GatC [Cyclobacteriaceae bacterium]